MGYPVIIVPGIGQSKTALVDENDNIIKVVWPLSFDVEKFKKAVMPSAIRMMIFRSDLGFCKKASKEFKRQLDCLASNPDGTLKHRLKPVTFGEKSYAECDADGQRYINKMIPTKQICSLVGEDNFFFFTYYSFGNTYDIVESLKEYIDMVKKKKNVDKVNLLPISLGGTVTTAYLDKYGDRGDINRVVGVVAAFNGTTIAEDVFNDEINSQDYYSMIELFAGAGKAKSINKLLKYIPKKVVVKFINEMVLAIKEKLFLNSSMAWGTVPARSYMKLADKYLSDKKSEKLRERTDKAYQARSDFNEFIRKAKNNGIDIFSLCGYDIPILPAFKSTKTSSDMIVPTFSCSMGASVCNIDECFEDGYVAKNTVCKDENHNHISPDNIVDASCSAIADTTWFFKGMDHEGAAGNEKLLTLAGILLKDETIKTVFDDENYPQFN